MSVRCWLTACTGAALLGLVAAVLLRPGAPLGANTLGGITEVTAGGLHTCALTSSQGVMCWGENVDGQLGDGTTTPRSKPGAVTGLASGVAAVAAGGDHTCAITTGGGVKCWGWDRYGQLGNGEATGYLAHPTPEDVVDLSSGIVAIATGGVHTCALTSGGGVKCWGWNRSGQVGDGQACGTVCTHPVDVSGLTSGVTAIAAAGNHSCALLTGGTVKCWGENISGELGAATASPCVDPTLMPVPCATTPVDVSGLSGVAAIGAGYSHTCALLSSGHIDCWGDNSSGQLGDAGTCGTSCVSPAEVSSITDATSIATGGHHTCAITGASHAVSCWGENVVGQLGNGDSPNNQPSPVAVCAAGGCASGTLDSVTAIAGGTNHNCVLMSDGALTCWGDNSAGQLGDSASCGTSCDTPVDVLIVKETPTPTASPVPSATPTPSAQTGDANCDGSVDSIDAALVLQYGAGLIASLPCQSAADANHDGSVDAIDAALILQYVAGLLPNL